MTYSCSDFTDTILDALGIVVPEEAYDDPSAQADLALEQIAKLRQHAELLASALHSAVAPATRGHTFEIMQADIDSGHHSPTWKAGWYAQRNEDCDMGNVAGPFETEQQAFATLAKKE